MLVVRLAGPLGLQVSWIVWQQVTCSAVRANQSIGHSLTFRWICASFAVTREVPLVLEQLLTSDRPQLGSCVSGVYLLALFDG